MKLQASNEQISSADRALGFTLAAFSMFVVGYTITRAFLTQPKAPAANNAEIVIPHQATLWSDFGN